MADLIPFPGMNDEPDLDTMDLEALTALLEELTDRIIELDEEEPETMEGDAFEAWAQQHEELEDLVDDVLDRIDELC